MSYKAFNPKNRTKKGISPVIATVILVAVAVVIAAALAGFTSSLFGTYSSTGAAVSVVSVVLDASTEDATIILENNGNIEDKLVSVQAGTTEPFSVPGNDGLLPAGGSDTVVAADLGATDWAQGDIVTVKMTLRSGQVLSQSVVASP